MKLWYLKILDQNVLWMRSVFCLRFANLRLFSKYVKFLLGAWKCPSKKTFNLLLSRYQLWYYETLKFWVSSSWTILQPRGLSLGSSQGSFPLRPPNSSLNFLPWGIGKMRNHFFYSLRNGEMGNNLFISWGMRKQPFLFEVPRNSPIFLHLKFPI